MASVEQLQARVAELEAENERLRREAASVAEANARAAMEILAIGDDRQEELEAKNREIAASLDRAEEALRQKSRFLANMSHELRTPLNGILGMAELLQNSELDGRQRDFVQSIVGAADTFLEMVNELLDFSKIEAGKLELENAEYDLWVVADAVAQDLQLRCDTKGLEFSYYLAPELPRRVRGDALRLRQVVLNLGSNAVKFTDRGSVQLELAYEPQTSTMVVRVRDTGCGIDAAVAPRLFQPFVQADASTTRNFGGTGLGLAISRQLARRMGGDLTFTSTPRVGTEFVLQMPIAIAAAPPATVVAKGTVAVVAKQPSTQRLLADHLPALGYRTSPPVDGQRIADLLIVEAMGGEAAIEGLERMRPDGAGPPLLLVLPPHHTIAPARLAALGVIGVLVLPVRPTQLAAQLQPAPLAESKPGAATLRCGAHVLVAEDIQVNRKVIEAQLTRLGCRVTSVDNGEAAVQAAIGQVFDIILMDCQMPRLDGQQATMAIRALEAGRNRRTPVIALTANALPGDREACLVAGMDDYLSKPLRQADLIAMMQRWRIVPA